MTHAPADAVRRAEEAAVAATPLPANPYVGLRPFEAPERMLFFGRDEDARMLRDKVFSARLTVLYGPSGIGKSSILRALLIPELDREFATTIYFDTWRGGDPLGTLKQHLIAVARRHGVADPEAGAPTLVDLVRLLVFARNATVVLVLDQFEELFVGQSPDLAPLRKELGALVRVPALDARVLLSLREEHLAALEAFRPDVITLFQSTFRLEPLDLRSTREAIERPASFYGVTYEPALLTRLVEDLAIEPTSASAFPATSFPGLDLPLLQLMCGRLWNARGKDSVLTLALYTKRLKGREGIISSYLHDVMPSKFAGKRLTARLMQTLAPPDGHKISVSAAHLASITGVPVNDVRRELERLSDKQVLRSRQYGPEALFELWHDSFVRIIGPWRDQVLGEVARRSRLQRAGLLLLVLVAAVVAWKTESSYREREEFDAETVAVWRNDQLTTSRKFDSFAGYLLGRGRDDDLDLLARELKSREEMLPADYGIERLGATTHPPEDWPLVLKYSSARNIDPNVFQQIWRMDAKVLNLSWGIPVPPQVLLKPDDAQPQDLMTLEGSLVERLDLELPPALEQRAVVSLEGMLPSGTRFFERFRRNWEELKVSRNAEKWWIVPRWSLPAWRAAGVLHAYEGSAAAAMMLVDALQKNPDRMLTEDAVEVLLHEAAGSFPYTVAQARMARGANLAGDFQALVRDGQGLTGLPWLLDSLSGYHEGGAEEVALAAADEARSPRAQLPQRLHGPFPAAAFQASPKKSIHPVYQSVMDQRRAEQASEATAVRLHLDPRMQAAWLTRHHLLRPELHAAVQRAMDEVMRRTGVMPTVRVFRSDQPLRGGFSIGLLDVPQTAADVPPAPQAIADPLLPVREQLASRAEEYRVRFVTAETVERTLRDDTRGELRDWLRKRYATDDLKHLLRGVINPAEGPDAPGGDYDIRHAGWLLGSLVFWAKVQDPMSVQPLVESLRGLQRARSGNAAPPVTPTRLSSLMERGVSALAHGKIGTAEASFASALAMDRRGAVSLFPVLYARELRSSLPALIAGRCRDAKGAPMTVDDRIDLEEILAPGQPVSDAARDRDLGVCLLQGYPASYRSERRALALRLLERYPDPGQWPALAAMNLGTAALPVLDSSRDGPAADRVFALVGSALARFPTAQAQQHVDALVDICDAPGRGAWCWDRLEEMATHAQDALSMLPVAYAVVRRESPSQLDENLRWIDVARRQNGGRPSSQSVHEQLEFIRAATLLKRAQIEAGAGTDEAKEILLRLVDSDIVGAYASERLTSLYAAQGDVGRAREIVLAARRKWPGSLEVLVSRLTLSLFEGDIIGLTQTAVAARSIANREREGGDPAFAFVATIGYLMAESGPWERAAREFLASRQEHEYKPYVAMILSARLTGTTKREALDVLQRLWAEAAPDTWDARLAQGDISAWREMLIGYYLGRVPRERIFGQIENPVRFASSNLVKLPMGRKGLLCEAYFYEALLAQAESDAERFRSSLRRVIDMGMFEYHEYPMAVFLLKQAGA